jgi:pilus assembly protein CpaF
MSAFGLVASPPDTSQSGENRYLEVKRELHDRLMACIDLKVLRTLDEDQLRQEFRRGAEELCRKQPDLLNQAERKRLIDDLVDETLGCGPIEPLLRDPTVSDILINGPTKIFVERFGRIEETGLRFHSEQHLVQVLQRMVSRVGRRIDESSPMVDARLSDGSRINAVIRPLALDGALVSIRRRAGKALTPEGLVANQALSSEMLCLLAAAVRGRLNIIVSGGTGGGKTTLLNAISSFVPDHERIVTIEDAAELCLQQPHVARMESRPPNIEGSGQVTTRDLLRNALRMRPDRIIIGECRGDETLDMLQAMNTGQDGSMTTLHANSASDVIARLHLLVGLSGIPLPAAQIDRQIAAGVQMVVHVARLAGGERRVMQLAEIDFQPGVGLIVRDIFRFLPEGRDPAGRLLGRTVATGAGEATIARLKARGIALPEPLIKLLNNARTPSVKRIPV